MSVTRSQPTCALRHGTYALPDITVPATIPDYDGLLPLTALNNDLVVAMPLWPGAVELMRLQAAWKIFSPENPGAPGDSDLVGTFIEVQASDLTDPDFVFSITVPKDLLVHGVYLLSIRTQTNPGGVKEFTTPIRIEVDTVAPGGGSLPFLTFNHPVDTSLIIGDDDIVGGILPAFLAHYEDIKPGDIVTPWVQGVPYPSDAIEIPKPLPGGEYIDFGYSLASLEAANNGPRNLSYTVTDKAGNIGTGPARYFTVDLNSRPENIKPPEIPLSDDGLIGDADARTPVEVLIPAFLKAKEGDDIVVHWGDQSAAPVKLKAEDLPEDPFIGVLVPYEKVEAAGNGAIIVRYSILRNGKLVGNSPDKTVMVDLTLVGGPDPDPDPVHGNLHPALIRSASGEENEIPPDDFDKNATATIAWLGKDGSSIYALNDEIRLTWGDQTGSPVVRTILQTDIDAAVDLVLTILSGTIEDQGSGVIPVGYTVSRDTSVPPFKNTSLAPNVDVPVTSKAELPGGGVIAEPTFPVLNVDFGAIGRNELIPGPEGLHNPVRIALDYTHAAANDELELFFVGYDRVDTGGNLVPDAAYHPPRYPVTQMDIDRGYYEFRVPARHHFAVCSRGSVEAHVIVRNAAGGTTSPKMRVNCDVKLPSETTCPVSF